MIALKGDVILPEGILEGGVVLVEGEKICLVTDSIKAASLGEGLHFLQGLDLRIKGKEVRLAKSGILAGSVLTLNEAVRNTLSWTGMAVNEAVNLASLNPARVLSLEQEIGAIRKDRFANLAVFDRNFNAIETIYRGKTVYHQ